MDIQKLIDDDTSWLKSEITLEKIGEYYEITTPYLDNANANQGLKRGRKTAQKSRECKYVANKSHKALLRCLRQ